MKSFENKFVATTTFYRAAIAPYRHRAIFNNHRVAKARASGDERRGGGGARAATAACCACDAT